MGLISLLWGICAMVLMVFALIPLLGAANWLLIPFAAIGAVIAAIAEHHRLNGDGSTPIVGNVVQAAVRRQAVEVRHVVHGRDAMACDIVHGGTDLVIEPRVTGHRDRIHHRKHRIVLEHAGRATVGIIVVVPPVGAEPASNAELEALRERVNAFAKEPVTP